jgi:hypothetical protein
MASGDAQAAPKPKGGQAVPPKAKSFLWLQGLVCGALATMATPTAVVLGVLMLPAIIANLTETAPGKPLTRVLALFGAAAIVGPLATLWTSQHTLGGAMALVEDPAVLSLSYAAAGAGWLLAELVPVAVRSTLEAAARTKAARLRAARARLQEEWRLPESDAKAEPKATK